MEACTKARILLMKNQRFTEDEIRSVAAKFTVLQDENQLFYLQPRSFICNGKVKTEKLYLVKKKSQLAKLILQQSHIHQCSVGHC